MICKLERTQAILVRLERINAIYSEYPPGTWAVSMPLAHRDELQRLDAELQTIFAQKEGAA